MNRDKLKKAITEALEEREKEGKSKDTLEKEIRDLKEELEDVRLQKKITEEDIKHMLKINTEKNEIQMEKHKLETEKEYTRKVNESLEKYHGKMETRFKTELENFKELYGQIIKRLPDVNYNIEEQRGQKVDG